MSELQKSPIVERLENEIAKLKSEKARILKQLKRQKTTLENLKTALFDLKNKLASKAQAFAEKYEKIRLSILKYCEKIIKKKKLKKKNKKEIEKIKKDLEDQKVEMPNIEEMIKEARENNEEKDFSADSFKAFKKEPEYEEKRNIRKIFLKLAAHFHPDKTQYKKDNESAHIMMKRINEAYTNNDIETLLEIETFYMESREEIIEDKKSYEEILNEEINKLKDELIFLKNQKNRVQSEIRNIKKSEEFSHIIDLRKEAKREKIDPLTYATLDMENQLNEFLFFEETIKKAYREENFDFLFNQANSEMSEEEIADQLLNEFLEEELDGDANDFEKAMMKKILQEMIKEERRGSKF